MSTVELRRLTKIRDAGGTTVDHVDLSIADGELFVLVGPSGCGKTTVLRMIAGLEHPTSGDVLIDGVRANDVDTMHRDVAMMFQDCALYPNLTVRENLAFPLRLGDTPRREVGPKVEAMARMLELTEVLDRLPSKLSGGQQQRVAMGRALIRRPRLLLMDEPMSNLDAKLRTEIRTHITRIQRRIGVTTVYVTHDQIEAMAMSDRVAVMRRGKVVQCGPAMDLFDHPLDLFVAQFVGSPSMNALLLAVRGTTDVPELVIGHVHVPVTDPAVRELVAPWVGGQVVVGIRPEAFVVDEAGPFTFSPSLIEPAGAHHIVHASVDAYGVTAHDDGLAITPEPVAPIVVSVEARHVVTYWKPLRMRIDTSRLHLFDPRTGLAIDRAVALH